jgi:hypothetical protein
VTEQIHQPTALPQFHIASARQKPDGLGSGFRVSCTGHDMRRRGDEPRAIGETDAILKWQNNGIPDARRKTVSKSEQSRSQIHLASLNAAGNQVRVDRLRAAPSQQLTHLIFVP